MQKAKWLGPVFVLFFLMFTEKKRCRSIISVATSVGREVKGQWREQELNPRDRYTTAVII